MRDLLTHLYDNTYLHQHPLLPLLTKRHMSDPMARAQHLRSLVIEAINSLRPPTSVPPRSKEWRPYGILVYRYLDGMSDEQIQRDLAISQRQLFRDLKAGIASLTSVLQAQAAAAPEMEDDALAASLMRVGLRLERLDLGLLCQQVLPLVQGLSKSLGKAVHAEEIAHPATVVADAALSRQALISALSHSLRHARGDVALSLADGAHTEALVMRFAVAPAAALAPTANEQEPEALAVSRQLLEQQGGFLQVGGDGECLICLHWRRFEEPRILIVEDDPGMLRLFSRCLNGHGYRVIGLTDGREAVRLAGENQVRLVVLDVMMRDIDGWAVLQRLKAEPMTRSIPILVCSVINEPELAITLGATALLKKPVSCEQLLDTVASIVGI